MISEGLTLVTIGFGLGLVHALDADHVMAVSVLSNQRPGVGRTLRYSMHWAAGHAGVLLCSGLLLFGFGLGLPEQLTHAAEIGVGLFLIVMGVACLRRFRRERIRLVEHSHGDIRHSHLFIEGDDGHAGTSADAGAKHAPVMVGVLHGFAGSAPALALVPMVMQDSLWQALAYLVLFSLGVMLAMLVFGFGLSTVQLRLGRHSLRIMNGLRHLIAYASCGVGGYWLIQAW